MSEETAAQQKNVVPGTNASVVPSRQSRNAWQIATIVLSVAFVVLLVVTTALYVDANGLPHFGGLFRSDDASEDEDDGTYTVCVDEGLRSRVKNLVDSWSDSLDTSEARDVAVEEFNDEPPSECEFVVSTEDEGSYDLAWRRYHVVVAPAFSSRSSISTEELSTLLGGSVAEAGADATKLVVAEDSYNMLDKKIGVGIGVDVEQSAEVDVVSYVTDNENALGVVSFEQVKPGVKVLKVDDMSIFDLNEEQLSEYPLTEEVWVKEPEDKGLFSMLQEELTPINFDPELVGTVVVTGNSVVGARGLYDKCYEVEDWTYPVQKVAEILQNATIAHLNNEASFASDCIQNAWVNVFCAPEEAFDLITYSGIDVVGLTGSHLLDAELANFEATLSKYGEGGVKTFGAGLNSVEASQAAVVEVGSKKIGFLGYNGLGPATLYADENSSGLAKLELEKMKSDIAALKKTVDYVFVDIEWNADFQRGPNEEQTQYAHAAIDAGATVVTGTNPDILQQAELYNGGVVFYSLGNFLFDELQTDETREGGMVRYYLYSGIYIGFEVIPIRISDDLQPEVVTGDDAERILSYMLPLQEEAAAEAE